MNIIRTIKLINRSKTLTNKEKRELISKGLIEQVINVYKVIIKLPFVLIGLTLCIIGCIVNYIGEGIELVEQVFRSIVFWLDDKIPEINLTKGQARDKMIAEIKGEKYRVEKADVSKAFENKGDDKQWKIQSVQSVNVNLSGLILLTQKVELRKAI